MVPWRYHQCWVGHYSLVCYSMVIHSYCCTICPIGKPFRFLLIFSPPLHLIKFSFYVIFVLCLFSVREYLNMKYKDTRQRHVFYVCCVCPSEIWRRKGGERDCDIQIEVLTLKLGFAFFKKKICCLIVTKWVSLIF